MNGFSTGEDDSRGASDQICCLVDDNERCKRPAGNASYSKRIQKTVTQRRLKLHIDNLVWLALFYINILIHVYSNVKLISYKKHIIILWQFHSFGIILGKTHIYLWLS